jgi:BlaR1 peptidase M56
MNYLLESTVCVTIFYGLYYLIFRRLTFVRLNRVYLLASLIIGLSLPLVSYQIQEVVKIPAKVEYEETTSMPLVINSSTPLLSKEPIEESFDWNIILQGIYVLGILFMLIKFSIIVYKLLKIKRLSAEQDFISTQSQYANSSFFNLIFIDDSNLSEHEINQILEHEKWHIRLFHSYDLLFVEILKIAFWFNPILWLYQRSLSEVHEYEVDTRMIQAYNPQTYAQLLLKLASSNLQLAMTHQFSRKPLTDRIHFLFTKQKSVPMKRLAYLSVLPILGAFFMAFSVEKVVDYQVIEKPDEKYFKVYKKPDSKVNNEVLVKENKIVSNLVYGKNRVALTMNPSKLSMEAIDAASGYFENIGFNLEVTSFSFYNGSKQMDSFELSLIENSENKKKYRSKITDEKTELPSKYTFDLKKMKRKGLDDIITIFADRSTGEYFVASLVPPPPPPVPPLPPLPPPPPVKGKTKLSMVRTINATGLIVDSETLLPLNNAELYDDNNQLLGKTNTDGFFDIEFGVNKEGEIRFKLFVKKDGYAKFTQGEHWGDLNDNLNATYYFGLGKKWGSSEPFSELVTGKKYTSYDEIQKKFSFVKDDLDFEKKIEIAKKNNSLLVHKIDNDYYLISDSGWIKMNSENDKIIVNGDKIFSANVINLYVKRKCVEGMSPIQSKNASFEIQDKCSPSKPLIKVGMKSQSGKDEKGEIMINNERFFYATNTEGVTTIYNRFGVQVDKKGKPLTVGNLFSIKKDSIKLIGDGELGKNPLVFINGKSYPSNILHKLNPTKISNSATYRSEAVLKKFGVENSDGAIEINTFNRSNEDLFLSEKQINIAIKNEVKRREARSSGKTLTRVTLKEFDGMEKDEVVVYKDGRHRASATVSKGGQILFQVGDVVKTEDEMKEINSQLLGNTVFATEEKKAIEKLGMKINGKPIEAIMKFNQ